MTDRNCAGGGNVAGSQFTRSAAEADFGGPVPAADQAVFACPWHGRHRHEQQHRRLPTVDAPAPVEKA